MAGNKAILNTERLAVRQFEVGDAEFILRLLNETSFLHFIGDKGVRCVGDAVNYLASGPIASYQAHGFGLFHVAELSTGASVGMCGLLRRAEHEHPDIGFAFLSQYRKQGYAYESAKAVIDYGQRALRIDTIVAFVSPDNERSIRLLERLGLHFVGEARVSGISGAQRMYSNGESEGP